MPQAEVAAFRENLAYARHLCNMGVALQAQVTSAMDVSDLYRAALVHGVSALDHFVHEEVRVRMLALSGLDSAEWPDGFKRFRVSMSSVDASTNQPGAVWLDEEIRAQHGHLSFQHPAKIADAFRKTTNEAFWPTVAGHLGLPVAGAKNRLKLIVDRRNKIAHEADMDPTPPKSRYSISAADVRDSLDFLESIVSGVEVAAW